MFKHKVYIPTFTYVVMGRWKKMSEFNKYIQQTIKWRTKVLQQNYDMLIQEASKKHPPEFFTNKTVIHYEHHYRCVREGHTSSNYFFVLQERIEQILNVPNVVYIYIRYRSYCQVCTNKKGSEILNAFALTNNKQLIYLNDKQARKALGLWLDP